MAIPLKGRSSVRLSLTSLISQRRFYRILRVADRHRDTRQFARAAEAYRTAVALAPQRNDLKVQLANMLKDCGDLAGAEVAYADALAVDPANADIHLQLGHLRKLAGQPEAAVESYQQALLHDTSLAAAREELSAVGGSAQQLAVYDLQASEGGINTLLTILSRLEGIGSQLDEMRNSLPDAQALIAFPIAAWSDLRTVFAPPAPRPLVASSSICILLLADREPLDRLILQIAAIADQSHTDWALWVVGSNADRRDIVRRASAQDSRIGWIEAAADDSLAQREYEIASASKQAWTLFLAPGAILNRLALEWISYVAARTHCDGVICDEEIDDTALGGPRPVLRQVVDRDTLLEANIYGETVAVATPVLTALTPPPSCSIATARSLLLLGLVGRRPVAHLPLPLSRTLRGPDLLERQAVDHEAAVRLHLAAEREAWVIAGPAADGRLKVFRRAAEPDATICLIVPTKNNSLDALKLARSLFALAESPDAIEILVLNNGGPVETDANLLVLAGMPRVRVHPIKEPFNWSRFGNLAAQMTTADIIVFANDDMLMLSQGWDEVIRGALERPDVGAIGARLLYPDGTIQHGGVMFNWRGAAIHEGLREPGANTGPTHRWALTRSVSAVDGAFLATRRERFIALGGFDAVSLPICFSDIDYALRLRAVGLRILWSPHISLFHHESKTRGYDHLDPAKAARSATEAKILEARWPGALSIEPGVNPFWHQAIAPFRLVSYPSAARIWEHVALSAALNPWRVSPADA